SQPAGTAFTVTLSNQATLFFAAGATEAVSTPFAIQGDDVYQDGDTFSVSVSDAGAHNFEQLTTGDATVTVTDTESPVTAELAVDRNTATEGDGSLTYTVTLKDADGNPVIANNAITVTTSQGEVTIAAGESTGTLTVAVQGDDVYVDGATVSNVITAISEANAGTAGSLESLSFDDASVDTVVSDSTDTTTLTFADVSVAEGSGTATVTGTLSQPAGTAFTVTLSNQATLFFAAGATEAVSTPFAIQGDDVYVDGESQILTVSDAGAHNFEQLTTGDATVTVTDTESPVTAELAVDRNTATEGDGSLTYTVTLKDADGKPVIANNAITVTTSQGDVIIAAGASSGTLTVAVQGDDVYADGGSVSNAITAISEANAGDAGSLESLSFDGTAVTTAIGDSTDTTTLTFADVSVAEGSGTATVTGTLSQPAGTAFTVTLSNQAT
ncbi:immunoglobulin-like domain-containing protein, partial [uncultured Oceanisphaera sp.]|uniref:immunoglobulin-like domain-containing protein n=1 Tax=uncultured Oceanisphaera sp. TaxID=353858 RepID=UPI00260C8240